MKPAILLLLAAAFAHAQTPAVTNAKMETRAVSGDPLKYLRDLVGSEAGPTWFGYAVASNRTDNNSCCWDNNCAGCRLEGGRGSFTGGGIVSNGEPVKLEGSTSVAILYRVDGKAIGKIRPVSLSCPLDAGGLRFIWLTGVTEQSSVAFLSEQVSAGNSKRDADSALVAVAMHAGERADVALEGFASASHPEWLREKALFWLASSRGDRGFQAVKNAAERDPSDNVREKAMFHLSLCKEPEAIDELIHFAKADPSSRVRGQALFWLAQKAGSRATQGIKDAIDNDPDTEVKKKAVFALQQLPKGEGVPLLIDVAKNNRNSEVRKQAMFWLGQSGDPRALALFQDILAR